MIASTNIAKTRSTGKAIKSTMPAVTIRVR
jgi:hypothetical protein